MKGKIGTGLKILGVIALAIFEYVIIFGFAYFGGWILSVCVGKYIADGLNTLFGATRFTADIIPLICATVATVGSFFRTSISTQSK